MKKLMTVFLAAALVFAIAGQASAATALETSGEYRGRSWYLGNYFSNGQNVEFWDQRLRLTGVWAVAEGVKVTIRADIMEGFWGDQVLTKTTVPAVAATATTPAVPETTKYTADANPRKAIDFDQVNLQFNWPNTPLTVFVGRQTTTWGPGAFVAADNRDRFRINAKFGDATVFYTFDKYIEVGGLHDTASLDDRSQHSFGAVATAAGWNLGAIVCWIPNETDPNVDSNIYGGDVYAMGNAGPVGIKAEVAYATGKNDLTVGQDVDLSALIAYLGVSMPAGPVTLGLEGIYSAGDDPSTKDKNEGVLASEYQSPFWSIILFNNLDYNGYMNESRTGASGDNGVSNAMAGKFSVAVAPAPGLSIYAAAVYADRLEDTATAKAAALGTELDLVLNYAITPNVSWTVGGGYLVAGDFYKDADNPWGAMSAFSVKF